MGHTERYGVRLRFECNRVTHLLHRDAGTACLRGARYAPTDPMESAKRALDGSQPVDGARELEPRTLVRNRHLGAPFHTRIRAHENNNVAQAARSRLAPVRWCRAALGGQAGCMAPPVARFAALASPGGGIEHGMLLVLTVNKTEQQWGSPTTVANDLLTLGRLNNNKEGLAVTHDDL